MARPKQEEGQPSIRTQMLDAFWDLIEKKPCTKITVADVANSVGVNRNTFYYHFQDVPDYIEQAVTEHLNSFTKAVVSVIRDNLILSSQTSNAGKDAQENTDKMILLSKMPPFTVKRANLLVGPNSSAYVISLVKQQIYNHFLESFGIEESKMEAFDAMSIRFVLAGVIEVWNCIGEYFDPETITFDQLFSTPIAQSILGMLKGILERQGLTTGPEQDA